MKKSGSMSENSPRFLSTRNIAPLITLSSHTQKTRHDLELQQTLANDGYNFNGPLPDQQSISTSTTELHQYSNSKISSHNPNHHLHRRKSNLMAPPTAHPTYKRVMESYPAYQNTAIGLVDSATGRLTIDQEEIDMNTAFGLDSLLEDVEFNGYPIRLSEVLTKREKSMHINNQLKLLRNEEKYFTKHKSADDNSGFSMLLGEESQSKQLRKEPARNRKTRSSPGEAAKPESLVDDIEYYGLESNNKSSLRATVSSNHKRRSQSKTIKTRSSSPSRTSKPHSSRQPAQRKTVEREVEKRPQTFADLSTIDHSKLTTGEKLSLGLLRPIFDAVGASRSTKPSKPSSLKSGKKSEKYPLSSRLDKKNSTLHNVHGRKELASGATTRSASVHADNSSRSHKTIHESSSSSSGRKKEKSFCEPSSSVDAILPGECVDPDCTKCERLGRKIKSISLSSKNLQRQNGCLESIITQKRNLVEQLTKQVRGLIKENFQLAKGAGTAPSNVSIASLQIGVDNNNNALPPPPGSPNSNHPSSAPPKSQISKRLKTAKSDELQQTQASLTFPSSERTSNHRVAVAAGTDKYCPENIDDQDKYIDHLQTICRQHDKDSTNMKAEIHNLQRFTSDLLYTLNARGYEALVDFDGSTVDLFKCRGEHLLDLKGRDARLRIPAKRSTPQEALLKAVIGSQESLIQSLLIQIDNRMRENIGSRLSSENCNFNPDEESFDSGTTNAVLESEVLALCSLIEGACQRNPDLFHTLKEQHHYDSQGNSPINYGTQHIVIDAVLDRCQKTLCSSTPPSPRLRNGEREPTNPRSGTPTPYPCSSSSSMGKAAIKSSTDVKRHSHLRTSSPSHSNSDSSSSSRQRPNSRLPTRSDSPPTRQARNVESNQNQLKASYNGLICVKKRSKCLYCGLRFPPNATTEELEAHFQSHSNYQNDNN